MTELAKELAELVRAALVGWPETVRLCVVLMVVAATVWTIAQVLG